MAEPSWIAVDLGAESGRVMTGRFDGRTVNLEEQHRFANRPVGLGGRLHWNALELWREIQEGVSRAVQAEKTPPLSLGVDTWGVDFALLSPAGGLVGMPVHYRDPRTSGMLAAATSRVSKSEIFESTGIQFMEINTLYQLLALSRTEPELLSSSARLLLMPDFFHWALCGSTAVEFTNATTTQCFDPTARTWATSLLERLQIPHHMLGEVVSPGTRLGELRPELAEQLGIARIPVVAPPTHDTAAAVVAVPTAHTGTARWAYLSSGTWSLMGVEVNEACLTARALKLNLTSEGGVDGTYRLLKNIMGLWLVQQCRRSFLKRGRDLDYAELTQLAGASEPFRSLVDPDDSRFLNPSDMPEAMLTFCRETGQPLPESEGQFVRCALESLALKYRQVLGWLEETTGTPVEVIHIVGGGSGSSLLNQFTASACNRTVIAGPVEATALGNVLVQARTSGELDSLADIRQVVRNSCELQVFEPQDTDAWAQAVGRFAALQQRRL